MSAVEDRVRAEQVQVLARNLPFTTLTGVAVAILSAAGAAGTVGSWIWQWAVAFGVVAVGRLVAARFYWRAADRDSRPRYWGMVLTINTLFSGLMWLVFGIISFVPDNAAHALFVAIVQTGLTAASLASLSCLLPAQMAFSIPTMAGIILPFAVSGERTLMLLSVMAAVFLLVIYLSSRRAEAVLVESIRLRFDNQRLIEDLRRAKTEAEASSRAKSDFLAVMSHEIRTPMNGVTAMAELLGQTTTDAEQSAMLSILRQSADSMLTIIDDILDFSKIEAGRLMVEKVQFEPVRVIEDVAQIVASRAAEKGLELVVDPAPDLPQRVQGDPARLRQVLLNLVGNAVKFTATGHVRISAEAVCDGELLFAVEDTGIGIAPEQHVHLFQPFTQADSSVARRYGGSGLGLSICKRLLELMGGNIWLDSQVGRGSRFMFTLPAPSVEAAASGLSSLAGLRVKVRVAVDAQSRALARRLRGHGAQVVDGEADVLVRDAALADDPSDPVAVVGLVPFHHLDSDGQRGPVLRKPVRGDELVHAVAVAAGREASVPAAARSSVTIYHAPDPVVADAEGIRLLVAEDSMVNRMVVSKMLDRLGMVYDLAKDGAEAMTMFRAHPYGLVLTDFHMPEMDGVTLARTIRASRGGTNVPIVALTADVLPETATLCSLAGMQGYLTKPVAMSVLDDTIGRLMPRAHELRQPVHVASDGPGHKAVSQVLDTTVLEEIFGKLDSEALALLGDFQATTRGRLSKLTLALEQDDRPLARRHAHTSRGTARSVGAVALAEVFGAIDDALAADDVAAAVELARTAGKQLELFSEFIAGMHERSAATGGEG